MYETHHADVAKKGRINFTVWSEVFSCPECAHEVVFVDEALDKDDKARSRRVSLPVLQGEARPKTTSNGFLRP